MREISQKNTKKDQPNHDSVTGKEDTILENRTRKINETGNYHRNRSIEIPVE